ncbi:MAG: DUF4430 domain-containing protein [Ruminococcaceae bacterium]|nr:DUF4430 domain-containing protein [Oscillospiraceae bacterium]
MKNKKGLIGIIAAVAAVAVLVFAYTTFAPKTQQGAKNITIEVINEAQQSTVYEVNTNAEFLEQAFAETDGLEITNEEGPYGMTIVAVNGEEAKWEVNGAYWSIMVNGEYGMYGASEQVVADGDAFQLVFTKG